MAEVIHEHDTSSNNNMGFIVGIILMISVLFFFFYYGTGMLRQMQNSNPTIQIPDKVDVNINQPEQ